MNGDTVIVKVNNQEKWKVMTENEGHKRMNGKIIGIINRIHWERKHICKLRSIGNELNVSDLNIFAVPLNDKLPWILIKMHPDTFIQKA